MLNFGAKRLSTYFEGKYSMPNVATGIKSNCVLKGLINIEITIALIFLMSICAVHIEFYDR